MAFEYLDPIIQARAMQKIQDQNRLRQQQDIVNYLAPQTQYQLSDLETFGPEDPINQLRQNNPNAFLQNLPGLLPRDKAERLAPLLATGTPQGQENLQRLLLERTFPQPQKLDQNILEYQQATALGLVPQGTTFEQFIRLKKSPLVQVGGEDKPVPLSEYKNLIDTRTGKPPKPSENLLLGKLPSYVISAENPLSGDTAARQASIDVARSQLGTIKNTLFSGGNVDTGNINQDILLPAEILRSDIPLVSYAARNLVSPDAIRLSNAYEYGIQAITRAETGAAMQPSELSNTAKRFFPLNTDPPDVQRSKVRAYELFVNNIKDYLDPDFIRRNKTGSVPLTSKDINFDKLLSDAQKSQKKSGSTIPRGWTVRVK